jgi:beta-lactamase class A
MIPLPRTFCFRRFAKVSGCIFLIIFIALLSVSIWGHRLGSPRQQGSRVDTERMRHKLDAYFVNSNIEYELYFQYLPSGQSISLGETNSFFTAAALLKLPFVMNMYRAQELGRLDLDRPYDILPQMRDRRFGDLWKTSDTQIKLADAGDLALRKSDNTANNVVKHYAQPRLADDEQVMSRLKLHLVSADEAAIDAKSYSRLLSCLYDACFNNRHHSDRILRELSETTFPGIADGVPRSVKVAHKVGISMGTHNDCGIIYAPGHPYILCIMLKQPRATYAETMQRVSRLVYTEVTAQ